MKVSALLFHNFFAPLQHSNNRISSILLSSANTASSMIKFKHHIAKKTSTAPLVPQSTSPQQRNLSIINLDFIDFNSPEDGSQLCQHAEILPPIPPQSKCLIQTLQELKGLHIASLKKSRHKPRRRKPTPKMNKVSKINGYTAFKSYYSRHVSNVCQGMVTSMLSKVWLKYDHQDIWDTYARHYRRYKRTEAFSEWLDRNTRAEETLCMPTTDDFSDSDVSSLELDHSEEICFQSKPGSIASEDTLFEDIFKSCPELVNELFATSQGHLSHSSTVASTSGTSESDSFSPSPSTDAHFELFDLDYSSDNSVQDSMSFSMDESLTTTPDYSPSFETSQPEDISDFSALIDTDSRKHSDFYDFLYQLNQPHLGSAFEVTKSHLFDNEKPLEAYGLAHHENFNQFQFDVGLDLNNAPFEIPSHLY